MTEYKQITEKEIWLVAKDHHTIPKRVEYVGAYWHEDTARKVAAQNLPNSGQSFTTSLTSVTLHGSAIDVK